jgi:hypothetical protein
MQETINASKSVRRNRKEPVKNNYPLLEWVINKTLPYNIERKLKQTVIHSGASMSEIDFWAVPVPFFQTGQDFK